MSQSEKKRQRAPNYTPDEKTALLSIILQYKEVIECKKSDGVTKREKDAAWKNIHEEYNAQNPTGRYRTMESLQKLYENQKHDLRQDAGREKRAFRGTGGGPGYKIDNPAHELLLSIINKKTVYGLSNEFGGNISSDEEEREGSPQTIDSVNDSFVEANNKCISDEDDKLLQEQASERKTKTKTAAKPLLDWGDYKSSHLKHKTNAKLLFQPKTHAFNKEDDDHAEDINNGEFTVNVNVLDDKPGTSTSCQSEKFKNTKKRIMKENVNNEIKRKKLCLSNKEWKSRRRPIVSALHSSNITKLYEELARKKLEIVEAEKSKNETAQVVKKQREEIEFNLKKRSLELDVMIKEAYLQRIKNDSQVPALFHVFNVN